jgi:hypothetical protein
MARPSREGCVRRRRRQHAPDRGRSVAPTSLYRFPRFSRRSRALLSAFKRGLRRMLASDLVRALANRCLRDIFFVWRSNVWPPSIGKTMCVLCVLPTKTRQCSARPHDASIEANALPCLGQRLGSSASMTASPRKLGEEGGRRIRRRSIGRLQPLGSIPHCASPGRLAIFLLAATSPDVRRTRNPQFHAPSGPPPPHVCIWAHRRGRAATTAHKQRTFASFA